MQWHRDITSNRASLRSFQWNWMKICFDGPPQSRGPSKRPVDGIVPGRQQAQWAPLYMCASWAAVGVLNGGQTCLTLTWVVLSCMLLSVNEGKLCVDGSLPADRYSRCTDDGSDRGFSHCLRRSQAFMGRQRLWAGWNLIVYAEAAYWPSSSLGLSRETWEGSVRIKPNGETKQTM